MSDPRLVEPQRATAGPAACPTHRYWCPKRITATFVLLVLAVALVAAAWWWVR